MKRIEVKVSSFFSKNYIKSYVVALACSFTLFQTACHHHDDDNVNNNNGSTTSVSTQGTFNSNDRTFIDSAALAGMAEVQLGQLALSKASDNSVRTFGQQMVTDHTNANNQLYQIAQSKNIAPPTQLDAKHEALKTRLSGYSGHQFDTAYINSQVIDHRKTISLFQREVNNSSGDPAVRGYASSNLPVLNTHYQKALAIQTTIGGGSTSGTTNGTTNGTTSSTTSGSTSGTTSGTTNSTTSGSTSGTTSGTTGSTTSGSTSGTTSGTTSSTTSGTTMGTTSSTTGGMTTY
jgi:putative membrane protein